MESDLGKLFIGGISWDTNEERLRDYFKSYGEVVEAVIMRDRATGRARGFGFVVFSDPAVAERVVMEKHTIDGRMVEAKKAVPRDDQHMLNRNNSSVHGSPGPAHTKKIFVGGLPSTITESDFKKYFDQFGIITDVVVMYDHATQRPRGFGFITYDSEDAVDKVLLKTFHELNGKMVEVKKAVPKESSPLPTMRSPIGGYNYSPNRVNSFLNGYAQGYSPSSIGSYGMRMDGRFGPIASARGSYSPFGTTGYGMGMNIDNGLGPNYVANTNYNNGISFGRGLNPYYTGTSSRFSSPIGYSGSSGGMGSVIGSTSRNLWGNGGLNYNTNSVGSNAFLGSGNGSLGGFANSNVNWGGSSSTGPAPAHASAQSGGSASGYGSLNYGINETNFGLADSTYRRNNGTADANSSFTATGGLYDGAYSDLYGENLLYGNSTWRSASSELDGSSPFDYGLGNVASDATRKSSTAFTGGYNITDRQSNRGIAT